MKEAKLTLTLNALIAAFTGGDDAGFRKIADDVIKEYLVANRHHEARKLQQLLQQKTRRGSDPQTALQPVRPGLGQSSLLRFVERPPLRETVFLNEGTARQVNRVVLEHKRRNDLLSAGLQPASNLLFWGPPGCGKTLTAGLLASELGLPLAVVRLSSVITSYVGETSANLAKIFKEASSTEMVLFFDEADAITKNREDPNDVGELKRVVNSLLQNLDEFRTRTGLVIFASNHQHMFDPAIWRRFDEMIEFSLPQADQRRDFIKFLGNGVKVKGSLRNAVRQLAGHSYADIERLVVRTLKASILRGKPEILISELLEEGREHSRKLKAAAGGPRRTPR